MLRAIVKRLLHPILNAYSKWYFSKPRNYRYKDLEVVVNPGVFFPHLTISTKLLLEFLDNENLEGKRVLELGAGTGIISIRCAKNGAQVTASDISHAAIENVKFNANRAEVEIEVIQSDLFDDIKSKFELVIINPPYYPKNPETEAEKAWFCGAEFEYFKKLSSQLGNHLTDKGSALMILSEDCQIETITQILKEGDLTVQQIREEKRFGENNFLFSVV